MGCEVARRQCGLLTMSPNNRGSMGCPLCAKQPCRHASLMHCMGCEAARREHGLLAMNLDAMLSKSGGAGLLCCLQLRLATPLVVLQFYPPLSLTGTVLPMILSSAVLDCVICLLRSCASALHMPINLWCASHSSRLKIVPLQFSNAGQTDQQGLLSLGTQLPTFLSLYLIYRVTR
eukprot:1160321-Pelagomonas_calceolata.AAC.9